MIRIKDHKRTIVSMLFFVLGSLFLTRLDYYFNHDLYQQGLIFSDTWYIPYSCLYFFLCMFYVLITTLLSHSWKLGIILSFFVGSAGLDLIYFGVWQQSFPTTDWTWMGTYRLFGTWTTTHQIIWTTALTIIGIGVVYLIKRNKSDKHEM